MLLEEPDAIVVGAVGTGAPWYLTGWAERTEVEFMIDTGCDYFGDVSVQVNVCCGSADP